MYSEYVFLDKNYRQMNVAIPVVDKDRHKYNIANGFNSTGYLCIYSTENENFTWMDVSDLADNMGELLPALISRKVNNVITLHIHPMALHVLGNKGFHIYRSEGSNLIENVELFNKDQLPIYDIKTSYANTKICGGECSVCSTECQEEKI